MRYSAVQIFLTASPERQASPPLAESKSGRGSRALFS